MTAEYYGKYPTGGGNREAYYKALESTANTARHSILDGTAAAGSAGISAALSRAAFARLSRCSGISVTPHLHRREARE